MCSTEQPTGYELSSADRAALHALLDLTKLVDGKVSLLSAIGRIERTTGLLISTDSVYRLIGSGLLVYGEGLYWYPELDSTEFVKGGDIHRPSKSEFKQKDLWELHETTVLGVLPPRRRFEFVKSYYDANTDQALDIYAQFLHVRRASPEDRPTSRMVFWLAKLFGETATDEHLPLSDLREKVKRLEVEHEQTRLNKRRTTLLAELDQLDTQLSELLK